MKIKGHGQAKVLATAELQQLFSEGFLCDRDRILFAVCLYSGCRISEALSLQKGFIDFATNTLTFLRLNTKGKKHARTIPLAPQLREYLETYLPSVTDYLFPAYRCSGHLSRTAAHNILKEACDRIGVHGVSTHSFRRTALTIMHNKGVPLRVIQKISGHSSLAALQKYLDVSDEQVIDAISLINR